MLKKDIELLEFKYGLTQFANGSLSLEELSSIFYDLFDRIDWEYLVEITNKKYDA